MSCGTTETETTFLQSSKLYASGKLFNIPRSRIFYTALDWEYAYGKSQDDFNCPLMSNWHLSLFDLPAFYPREKWKSRLSSYQIWNISTYSCGVLYMPVDRWEFRKKNRKSSSGILSIFDVISGKKYIKILRRSYSNLRWHNKIPERVHRKLMNMY